MYPCHREDGALQPRIFREVINQHDKAMKRAMACSGRRSCQRETMHQRLSRLDTGSSELHIQPRSVFPKKRDPKWIFNAFGEEQGGPLPRLLHILESVKTAD